MPRPMLGFALGWVGLGLVLLVGGLVTLRAWYWSIPDANVDLGLWHVGSTAESLLAIALAVPIAC